MQRLHRTLVLLLGLTLAACGQSEPPAGHADKTGPEAAAGQEIPLGQLPKSVLPEHYQLAFTMNPDDKTFRGEARIAIEIREPVETIWMHGKGLNVSSSTLTLADGETLDVGYEQVDESGVVKLALPRRVEPQKATLAFDYNAEFSDGLRGAYRVQEGEDWYVFTQFEAIDARRVFPGFDEPAFKVPFDISYTVPASDKVVANTPETVSRELENGMVRHEFATTKPLPTYLIAFAIGPLDIVEHAAVPANEVRDRPIPLRGVTVKGKGDQIAYALENTAGILKALETYFQIPYPYAKLDIIAVPDFAAGAMENAGAITYREILVLIPDPKTAPSWQLEAYASVHAHELAHQWFGNLVTMPWWDDIWLNEAFATWMATKAVERWNPDMPIDQDIAGRIATAMGADALATARQIRQPIESHHDIESAFDGITYSKGGSVLLMFERYLGEKTFQEGVQYHLKRFAWGNADVFDFLESLSHAAGEDIAPAFKTFLFQPGTPLIDFSVDCSKDTPAVMLSQQRYLPLGSEGDRNLDWDVPVCMSYGSGDSTSSQCSMFTAKQQRIELQQAQSCPDWVMPNDGGVGYYVWTLDDAQLNSLMGNIDNLNMLEQMSVVRSIKAGFSAGTRDTAQTLEKLDGLVDSEYPEITEAPMSLINDAREHLVSEELKDEVSAYARELYADYEVTDDFTPGNAPTDKVERQHHVSVAGFLANTGKDVQVRAAAAEAGQKLVGFGGDGKLHFEAVTPDFMGLALDIAVEESGADYYNHLVGLLKQSKNELVRSSILGALGGASEPELVSKTQALVLDPALERNEIPSLLFSYLGNEKNREGGWQWLKANFEQISSRMTPSHAANLPYAGANFCSQERAREVQEFFSGRIEQFPGGPRNLSQAVEVIELCAAKKKAQAASAEAWFSQRQGG